MSAPANRSRVANPQVQQDRLYKAMLALYDNTLAGEPEPAQPNSEGASEARVDPYFADSITFRDPLMQVFGVQDYRAQFAQLHASFPVIRMEVLSHSWGAGKGGLEKSKAKHGITEITSSDDKTLLTIDAICTYQKNKWITLKVRQTTLARVNAEGKFCEHEDLWSMADVIESLPLIGRLYRFIQPLAGRAVSFGIKKLWAYKAGVSDTSFNTETLHAVYHPLESQKVGKEAEIAERQRQKEQSSSSGSSSNSSLSIESVKQQATGLIDTAKEKAIAAAHAFQAGTLQEQAAHAIEAVKEQSHKLTDSLRNRQEHKQQAGAGEQKAQ